MATFLQPFPSAVDIRFDAPRSNHLSSSGLSAASFRLNGLWRGSISFAPAREQTPRPNTAYPVQPSAPSPMLSLTLADLPNAGFMIDLLEEERVPRDTNTGEIVLPDWVEASGDVTTAGGVELVANSGARAGDLISFRQSRLPGFVTARRIVFIDTNPAGDDIARLDTQLPEEIFVTASDTVFQYCLNRPHVRARFVQSPQRWRKDNPVSMRPSSVDWVEDTAAMIQAWREVSQISGVAPNELVTQSGVRIITQSGQPLIIQGTT